MENEKNNLENHVEQLENDLTQMEVKVKDMKEQQCLLVEYPDLNGPVNPDIAGRLSRYEYPDLNGPVNPDITGRLSGYEPVRIGNTLPNVVDSCDINPLYNSFCSVLLAGWG